MPLTLSELQDIQAAELADDVEIDLETMALWSKDDAEKYFASGGAEKPAPPKYVSEAAAPPPSGSFAWWSAADTPISLAANSRIDAAHTDTLSALSLFADTEGVLAEKPGEVLAATGSWDYSCRIWRLGDSKKLCELNHSQGRWVYSLACCGYLGTGSSRRVGIVSVHTGGMMGEPEHLIRLWSLDKARDFSDKDVSMLVNVEGADPTASEAAYERAGSKLAGRKFAHLRGVHAVDCCERHMATISSDLLVAWSLDRDSGRFSEACRTKNPLRVSSNPAGVKWLRGGLSLVAAGEYEEHQLPILDLPSGLKTIEKLHFNAGHSSDVIELADDEPAAPSRIVAAGPNRAWLYDRRAGPEPCGRLALQGITALASTPSGAGGSAPALLAAAGGKIHVYDVRKLPEDTKQAKVPTSLASLTSTTAGFKGMRVLGNLVVASDQGHGLSAWDVGGAPVAVS